MSITYEQAMKEGKFHVGKVCQDCMMVHVNGDDSGVSSNWNSVAFESAQERYDVTMGHPHHSEWWNDCPHDGEGCPDDADCDCAVTQFSRSACDMCGNTLHGYREDAIFVERSLLS
ncbi:hypothetical protein [Nocardia nova]|uniref:hypothetical protein n=1 Tax=Nocardia nova TaxID=37330 RepID=UPI0027393272|nr:hypothetical protein [Nocardia nova]